MFLLIASSQLLRTVEAPADSKALIKNTLSFFDSRLVVTQCYSVVKNHPPYGVPPGWDKAAFSCQFSVVRFALTADDSPLNYCCLVELSGIEPLTPWLQTRCSPS